MVALKPMLKLEVDKAMDRVPRETEHFLLSLVNTKQANLKARIQPSGVYK
jgi:hypothetical protein